MQKHVIVAGAATALAFAGLAGTAAHAQDSAWAFFEGEGGLLQAGVQAADGEQLILKCDETGEGEVFAVIFTPSRLKPPSSRPQPRDIRLRYDGGSPDVDSWRYYEQTAMALNTRRERQLRDFLRPLADADSLEVILYPVDGSPIEVTFAVTGARDAIGMVYESCEDNDSPLNE